MSSLSYQLSVADAALFESLQASAMLPSLAQPGKGELAKLYKKAMKEKEKVFLKPYADVLEVTLLDMLTDKTESILQQLKESKGIVFTAKLFTWKTVSYNETLNELKRRESLMTSDEYKDHVLAKFTEQEEIVMNGWESSFGAKGVYYGEETYDALSPIKVDRIFRNTDLADRISLALSPNFTPFFSYKEVVVAKDFTVFKKSLCISYHPFGLKKADMQKMLLTAKTQSERIAKGTVFQLSEGEYPIGHVELFANLSDEEDYADMPSLISTVVADKHHCFCGCQEDDE
jgi:hypothetical protein